MTEILKVLQLAKKNGVSQMEIRSRRIKAGLHAQRTALLAASGQAFTQLFFTN